jgi:hypothetical protein
MGFHQEDMTEQRQTGRLSVQTVERLHRLLGGEAHLEGMALRFIEAQYGAKSLFHLPPGVAREVVNRPADFLRAAKSYCEPELNFWESRKKLKTES